MRKVMIILFLFVSIIAFAKEDAGPKLVSDAFFKGNIDADMMKSITSGDLMAGLKSITFPKSPKGLQILRNECIDGIERPFAVYVPKSYDRAKEYSLVVYLHGLVGRTDIMTEKEIREELDWIRFKDSAEANNYILLFPVANADAMWWDETGTENVLNQIKYVKTHYNINDNAVFMTGFSDGASGSFYFAMCYPDIFAGFIPLNGHMGVASIDGGIQTYAQNMFNRPLHVINTDIDDLYPDKQMREMNRLAIEAGADINYRIYTGIGHDFDYADREMPIVEEFIRNTRRRDFANSVIWYTDSDERAGCDWLRVFPDNKKIEFTDYNMTLSDERISFGFYPDYAYEGNGVRVDKVAGAGTLCFNAGMEAGDIFIKLDDFIINNMDDMNEYKKTKQRGDSTTIVILRNNEKVTLKGAFPPVEYYPLFKRDNPTAFAEGMFIGNEFHITCNNVRALEILIDPVYVNLMQNVKVFVNGVEKFNDLVTFDNNYMMYYLSQTKDRKHIYANSVIIELK